MIPTDDIEQWKKVAPWHNFHEVEQDLLLSRALVEMFQNAEVLKRLAFRGATALYKLHITPAARYSEDIDLVQVNAEKIGVTMDAIRDKLDPWLGNPIYRMKHGRVVMVYRTESQDLPPVKLRLKIEINSREHFTELGFIELPYSVENPWFSGSAVIKTYQINEMMGTKLRALYQRKKGRDLFDIWYALKQDKIELDSLFKCFNRYMEEGGHEVTREKFEENLRLKSEDTEFRTAVDNLLRDDIAWNFDQGMQDVVDNIVSKYEG